MNDNNNITSETMTTFNISQSKVNEQIALAKELISQRDDLEGREAVIVAKKLSPRKRKVFYGFHFEPKGAKSVGDIYTDEKTTVVNKVMEVV